MAMVPVAAAAAGGYSALEVAMITTATVTVVHNFNEAFDALEHGYKLIDMTYGAVQKLKRGFKSGRVAIDQVMSLGRDVIRAAKQTIRKHGSSEDQVVLYEEMQQDAVSYKRSREEAAEDFIPRQRSGEPPPRPPPPLG